MYSTLDIYGTNLSREAAEEKAAQFGGFLVRSGTGDLWLVVAYPDAALEFRSAYAYGPDITAVSDEEWEQAEWDEAKLKGYRG